MELPPPLSQYISGDTPTHSSLKGAARFAGFEEEKARQLLIKAQFLSAEGKPTKKAADEGLLNRCEGKLIWSLLKTRAALRVADDTPKASAAVSGAAKAPAAPRVRTEPAWVDLDTIGTYFGVGKLKVGQWLDVLGMRALPTIEKNSSGDYDMADMANQAKEKQAKGFIGKEVTEKALQMGLARKLPVMSKGKEIEITQWNLDLCKAVLVKAGHPLDTEHKIALKGKGKNSNVVVNGIDARAKELYVKWARLYADPKTKWKAAGLFRGQPTVILQKCEELMQMPGYLTTGKYLQDK